ncbi:MAG TPA: aspartate aminotransferase family protein [Hypericibacter adhaerens]|jgi:4-aminobutyrate--pyruvate transaminase|uniref:Aspartate aminotransferase family protein n=1 Tax=Hypericibacter adhaerens TaxID=2602016 RepID=A0A5J6N2R7_9PROT|nr:aspartate aminotransferase family protein [Hypericibacter adhaerens]QEX23817.1 aspartate aminotransferase family protein [Hypericibacter adhaerens]HWA41856.1 aspartate aminotransferase family protein [Hypericibacter adhaerens]
MNQIKPNSLAARDIAYHLHGYTNAVRHEQDGPLILTEGKGIYVHDENGRAYIEGMAGLWSVSLGFGEERLVEAAVRQMKKLPYYHTFTHKTSSVTVELAEKLIGLAPVPMSKVFFANSGSEANDTVIKIVWYYSNALGRPKKKKIISRQKAYHGVTVATASLTGLPNNHRDFDLPIANIIHADCPHYYRFGKEGESEAQFAQRMADSLEKLILAEGPDTVAAFIAEPVMGAGGVIVPPAGYFDLIQPILKKYDILFIADEVICGFGRTGNMFGSETFKLKPDILSCAKALSSSYLPISGVMINEKVYQALRDNSAKIGTFGHGFTYSGHPVPAAVALETLKIYEERNILAQVRSVAPAFQRELKRFADHPLVGETRGIGLVGAIELVKDKRTKEPFAPQQGVGFQAAKLCQEQGLITRAIMDSLAFCPPLIITEAEIGEMFRRFAKGLDATWAWVREQGLAAA